MKTSWRHHTCPRFSMSKVVQISMTIPEDGIHIFVSPCQRWFEYQWEYLKMPYTSSFLLVEGNSNISENTWRHHMWLCFSSLKVIRISVRMLEETLQMFISSCRRWFEDRWQYLKMAATFSFLLVKGDLNINENTWRCHKYLRFPHRRWFEYGREYWKLPYTSSFLPVEGDSNIDENSAWWDKNHCLSMSKVIWLSMIIPKDAIHIFLSPCRRWFEYRWEYQNTSYMLWFLFVEVDSNINKNNFAMFRWVTPSVILESYSHVG